MTSPCVALCCMGMVAGMGSAMVFCGDIGAIGVGVDGCGDVMDAVGEVREFVTRRSSCIKRRNIAVLTPCPFETGAGQGKGVYCWMAGGMQPAHLATQIRCHSRAQDPSRRSSLGRLPWISPIASYIGASRRHRSTQVSNARTSKCHFHPNARCSAIESSTRRRGSSSFITKYWVPPSMISSRTASEAELQLCHD